MPTTVKKPNLRTSPLRGPLDCSKTPHVGPHLPVIGNESRAIRRSAKSESLLIGRKIENKFPTKPTKHTEQPVRNRRIRTECQPNRVQGSSGQYGQGLPQDHLQVLAREGKKRWSSGNLSLRLPLSLGFDWPRLHLLFISFLSIVALDGEVRP